MDLSDEELEEKSYRELQELAKENDIKATGKKEEILERLKEAPEGSESSESEEETEDRDESSDSDNNFSSIRDNIENELNQHQEITEDVERVKTGIEGLDDIVKGGIPENNLVLLSGGPGSGKTTMALQFLIQGIENGETGVYVNLDEQKEDIIRNAKLFGWDLEKHVENDDLHFVRPSVFKFKKAKRQIDRIANRFDAERIVIDSLSVLGSATDSESKMRRSIMELNQRFNNLDATTISISEVEGEKVSKHGVEEYSVDGIIRLYFQRKGSSFQRGVAIKKMRGSDHSKDLHPIEIGNKGVKVFPDEELFQDM